jgi:hypothetical protein
MTIETPYRLSIAPELEGFRPELEYCCDFLDAAHFTRRTSDATVVLHYGAGAPEGAIAVPAALFPHGVTADKDGLWPNCAALAEFERADGPLALFPRASSGGTIGYDALGLIFFMLSRLEERRPAARDRYGRFSATDSVLVRQRRMLDPPADQAAMDLAAAITGNRAVRVRSSYEVYLTHDVDVLGGYHRAWEPLRWAVGDLVKRGNPASATSRLYYAYLANEPWTSVRALMDRSEHHNIQSRFYFMGPSTHPMDSPYAVNRPALLRRVADEIAARGHTIGFHPGFTTATDAYEWIRQRDGLERIIGRPVREGRQHVLQYVADTTADIWDAAGMNVDCTLAYPEEVGFRAGTCRPFRAYSLRQRRALGLQQSCTAVMDFALFGDKYGSSSKVDDALHQSLLAADVCRRYGGRLTILYHTFNLRRPQWDFYLALLPQVLQRAAA